MFTRISAPLTKKSVHVFTHLQACRFLVLRLYYCILMLHHNDVALLFCIAHLFVDFCGPKAHLSPSATPTLG